MPGVTTSLTPSPPRLSEEDAKLRALAEAATPGPWTLGRAHDGESYDGEWWPQVWPRSGAPIADFNRRIGAKHKDAADAAYIAAVSPDVVLGLLDRGAQRDRLRDALEGMVQQFAYWSDGKGGYWTGGLSALGDAFEVLGWDDPHPAPEARCDEPGCMEQSSAGTPTMTGYRRTCHVHLPEGLTLEQSQAWREWGAAHLGATFNEWAASDTRDADGGFGPDPLGAALTDPEGHGDHPEDDGEEAPNGK